MKVYFATGNVSKVNLASQRLRKYGITIEQLDTHFAEMRSLDVEEIAADKAKQGLKRLKSPFIIEDSAFYIKELKGFPATYVKMAFDMLGNERIVNLLHRSENRNASIKSVLMYANPTSGVTKTFLCNYPGSLSVKSVGKIEHGWRTEKIFIPNGWKKTLAQMTKKEWKIFLNEIRKNDHYEQFGIWLSTNTEEREFFR